MKLLTRISLNFLSISLFIFLVGIVVFYYVLRRQMDEHINNELDKRKNTIIAQKAAGEFSLPLSSDIDQALAITPTSEKLTPEILYSDTIIYDENLERHVAVRQLQFNIIGDSNTYRVRIYKSLTDTDSLVVRMLLMLTILVILLIAGLLFLNRHTSQIAWKDFYITLKKVGSYDLNTHDRFTLKESDIKEFNDLNVVLTTMNNRIKNDYYRLKEYTENASHEIQTPLAVIMSKMELLLQSQNLNEKEMNTVADAYDASAKLSRLNATLLLLTKIGNNQFPETEEVDLANIAKNQLDNLEEVIRSKEINIHIPQNYQTIKMNRYLAEIMLANLIKNAVRHNIKGGSIWFDLSDKKLEIRNNGKEIPGDKEKIFDRFYRSSLSAKSMGLGLSLVQKICDVYGFKINYEFQNGIHCFCIRFSS